MYSIVSSCYNNKVAIAEEEEEIQHNVKMSELRLILESLKTDKALNDKNNIESLKQESEVLENKRRRIMENYKDGNIDNNNNNNIDDDNSSNNIDDDDDDKISKFCWGPNHQGPETCQGYSDNTNCALFTQKGEFIKAQKKSWRKPGVYIICGRCRKFHWENT
jgi:hypothetical protein